MQENSKNEPRTAGQNYSGVYAATDRSYYDRSCTDESCTGECCTGECCDGVNVGTDRNCYEQKLTRTEATTEEVATERRCDG